MRKKFNMALNTETNKITYFQAIVNREKIEFPLVLMSGRSIDIHIFKYWNEDGYLQKPKLPSGITVRLLNKQGEVVKTRGYGGRSWLSISEMMSKIDLFVKMDAVPLTDLERAEIQMKLRSLRDSRIVPVYTSDREATIEGEGLVNRVTKAIGKLEELMETNPKAIDQLIEKFGQSNHELKVLLSVKAAGEK